MAHRHDQRLGLVLLSLVLASACATTGSSSSEGGGATAKVGARLPDVTVKDFEGNDVSAKALRGKVVLLDIWASWCAPCKEELPMLDAMATRLRKKGIEILAISIDENRDDAMGFIKAHGAPWSLSLAHDPEGRVADRLKPAKMPTSYIIDRAGVVRQINAGFERDDAAKIEARLLELADQES